MNNLTKTQRQWLDHILAAKTAKQTLSDYAKEHDLKLHSLYSWVSVFKQKGMLENELKPFVAVKTASVTFLHLQLENGIRVSLEVPTIADLSSILSAVKSL